jgi:hypothetical protein
MRGHLSGMTKDDKRIIDMTLEGEFVSPPPPPRPPIGARIMIWAIVAMVLAMTVLIVALTFWFVLMILPVILAAAVIAYLAFRYQLWRSGRAYSIRRPGRW